MPGSGNKGTIHTLVTACSVRSGDVYQRYVSGLYRQALLTLAESVFRRCRCHHVRPAWGERDAYAGVGLVGQCGAA